MLARTEWITVHAGDFAIGSQSTLAGRLFTDYRLMMKKSQGFSREEINLRDIESVEAMTEESVTSFTGAAGGAIVGGLLLGPLGLLGGMVLGGKGNKVTFLCKLKDGRKFLGTASSKVFNILHTSAMAATFA